MSFYARITAKSEAIFAILFFITGATGIAFSVFTLSAGMVGWDSPIDTKAFNQISSIPAGTTLNEAYELVGFTSEFYGTFIQKAAQVLQCMFSNNCGTLSAHSFETYLWQGIVSIGIAVASGLIVSFAIWKITKSWVSASIYWAFIFTFPAIVGLTAIDYKDGPTASGLAIFAAGVAVLFDHRLKFRYYYAGPIVGLGALVTVSARPGAWPIILLIGLISTGTYFIILLVSKQRHKSSFAYQMITLASWSLLGICLAAAAHRVGRINPLKWLWDSYATMSHYPWEGFIWTAGQQLYSTELPWWYIPSWTIAQLPVVTALVLLLSLLVILLNSRRSNWGKGLQSALQFVPFFVLGIAIPTIAILSHATMYNGIRHSTYVYTFLAIVPAIGYLAAREVFTEKKLGRGLALILIFSAVLANLFATIRWLPYSYAYINEVVNLNSAPRSLWDLDYWDTSALEATQRFKALGVNEVHILGTPPEQSALLGLSDTNGNTTFGLYYLNRSDVPTLPSDANCELSFSVTRDQISLGEGYTCHTSKG